MKKRLTENIITSPEDKSFRRMVIVILTIVFAFTISAVALELVSSLLNKAILLIAAGTTLVCLIFAIRGDTRPGQILTPLIMFVALLMLNVFGGGNGIFDSGIIGLVSIITLASLLQGSRGTIAFSVIVSITLLTMGALDIAGLYKPVRPINVAFGDIGVIVIITIANGSLLFILIRRLTDAALKASENEELQIEANRELTSLKNNLEIRIKERTSALEEANALNMRRSAQFESITQVARATVSLQDLENLLSQITQLISQRFGFYHVGIFLVDENREYAVLRAANSKGGKRMIVRGHKLKVGETGIVGYVTGTGNPRISLDTGADAVYFNNPDLPETHSEIALPLRIAGELVGALDVQSTETNAFKQEDIEVLSTLADQVSVAIQNARSFNETQKLLAEARSVTSNYLSDAWKVLHPISTGLGYQKSGLSIKPLEEPLKGEHIQHAVEKGETITINAENKPASLSVPIRLRGQIIGVINLQIREGHQWNQDEVDIAEAVAARLSLAIETATLLQVTQHRADIERVTSDISSRISSSTHFEAILQIAAEELSRALDGSDVFVQIEPISIKLSQSS